MAIAMAILNPKLGAININPDAIALKRGRSQGLVS